MIQITLQLVGPLVGALQSVECKGVEDVDALSSERPPSDAVGYAIVVVVPAVADDDTFVAAIADNVAYKQGRMLPSIDA